ncbi:hypothetical protein [Patiriisocius marinus]|uniref:hypothetical protein n=1 Tax=Patiriisocius marinus TaxID=1397112 RepID=UPI00232D7104|nr:hypothetical protein [Patiriisocius marinus]
MKNEDTTHRNNNARIAICRQFSARYRTNTKQLAALHHSSPFVSGNIHVRT